MPVLSFYRPNALPAAPNQQHQSTEGKLPCEMFVLKYRNDSDQTKNRAEWRTHPSNKKKDVVTKRLLSSPSFSHWWHQISASVSGSRWTGLSCEDTARQSCTMVHRWWIFGDFLRPVFPASLMQHVSDLHSKFILRPHHVWKNGRHPICGRWD